MTIQTIEIILYTESLSSSNLSNTLRTKTKIHSARDTPSVAQIPIEIRIPHKTLVQRVLGVWYQAVEGLENLDGFTVIDFENISDSSGESIKLMLKASSIQGASKQVKLRVFVLYEQAIIIRNR
ncbi:MAG TPA: hypothetical protein VIW80_01685 [Pyrinomonadaceae bacterium]|jgi:hypothetical protein